MTNFSAWITDTPNGLATSDLADGATIQPPWVFDSYPRRIGVAASLILITVLGMIGNIGTIVAVYLSRKLQTTANAFVVNLSVASGLACATLPFTIANMFHNQETSILPPELCSFAGIMSYIAFSGTIVAHLLIAVDRVIRITRPNHQYHRIFKRRTVALMICLAWVYANLSFILGIITHVEFGYSTKYRVCLPDILDERVAILSLFRATTIDLFILIGVFISYTVIFVYIYQHNKRLLGMHKISHRMMRLTKLGTRGSMEIPTSTPRLELSGNGGSTTRAAMEGGTPVKNSPLGDIDFSSQRPSMVGNRTSTSRSTVIGASASGKQFPVIEASSGTSSLSDLGGGVKVSVEDIPWRVNDQGRPVRQSATPSANNVRLRSQLTARQVKITMNMFLVVAVFIVCITPYITCLIIDSFERIFPFVAVTYALSNAINPAIYAWKHPQFRSVFKPMVRCQCSEIPEPTVIVQALRDYQRRKRQH